MVGIGKHSLWRGLVKKCALGGLSCFVQAGFKVVYATLQAVEDVAQVTAWGG